MRTRSIFFSMFKKKMTWRLKDKLFSMELSINIGSEYFNAEIAAELILVSLTHIMYIRGQIPEPIPAMLIDADAFDKKKPWRRRKLLRDYIQLSTDVFSLCKQGRVLEAEIRLGLRPSKPLEGKLACDYLALDEQ